MKEKVERMKKSICKHISSLLTVMLILSALSVSVTAETAHTISATETTRVEGEDYSDTTHADISIKQLNSNDYGGAVWDITETTSAKYAVSYTLDVAVAGFYKLTVAGNVRGNSSYSNWTVYVNDTNNAPSSYTAGDTFRIYGIGPAGGVKYDCGTIYLKEGENTLYWSFGKGSGVNLIRAALDYFELSPPEMIPVSATELTKIEGEAYTGATVTPNIRTMNSPDDGQRAVNYVSFNPSNYGGRDFAVGYTLNVAEEGDYKLDAVATVRSQTYTSDWSFYVNTAENSVSTYIQGEDVATTSFLKSLFKKFDCGTVHLSAGVNILYWKVNDADAPNGILQAALDYFELTPAVALTNPALRVDEKLKKGENAVISVLNGDNSELGIGLFTNVSVTADDARIAIWQGNKLFAANCGKTMLTVRLTDMKGIEHELKKEITVVSEEGIWISDCAYSENGDIEVKISALEDYTGGDKVIAIIYDIVDGVPTSIMSANECTVPSVSAGSTQAVTVNLGSVSGTQEIAIFILSGSNNNRAIYSKYVIGGEL